VSLHQRQTSIAGVLRGQTPMRFLPFARGWLRNPVGVGLPFPSSPWTASRLARAALASAIPESGPVVELGAGTGAVTQAFIDEGWPVDRIVAVEQDLELCDALRRRFAGLQVLEGDALDLGRVLKAARLSSVGVVMSGLPMRAIPLEGAIRCYGDAFQALPPGGAVIQYTYGLRPPVDPQTIPNLEATFVGREWRNFPPMGIWRYSLGDAAGRRSAHSGKR
jgi:phosphatidylethanolamine/phosphatidyl-N-methylethanolamine N-methyltransferase